MDSKQSPTGMRDVIAQSLGAYQNANLPEAERLFSQVLASDPRDFIALHLLGIIHARRGQYAQALERIGAALQIHPADAEALSNYGNVLKSLSRFDEALAYFDKALAIKPNLAWVLYNRGNTLLALKRLDEALASYDRSLAIDPRNVDVLNNRGNILRTRKRLDAALASYDQALALDPNNASVLNNRGIALQGLRRFADAVASYDRALALKPDFADALANRGKALIEDDRIDDGLASLMRAAALTKNAPRPADPPHKIRHDQEQQQYRAGHRAPADGELGARLAASAITPDTGADIAAQWRTAQPQIVVIDDFLTDPALQALRNFCLSTPVWRKAYKEGYLGAFPEDGFAAPLLGQIAQEMRRAFPAIFGAHPLRYLWAFKYDSRMTGIKIHADEAAVNVNFWITPDDANLDPAHGGLVIWDKAAPLDWDFARFNNDTAAIRAFLADSGAQSMTVPYRANRAVIFDSDLFHETDTIHFKDGYQNRRINVTLLFGWRETGAAPGTA